LYEQTKQPVIWRRIGGEKGKILAACLVRFVCGFLFTAAAPGGLCLPLGIHMLSVSGPGLYGTAALLGVCLSAVLLWDRRMALELTAVAVLLRAAVRIFRDSEWAERPMFMPAVTALMTALIGGVLLPAGNLPAGAVASLLFRTASGFLGSCLMRWAMEDGGKEALLALLGCLMLSASFVRLFGLSLGILLGTMATVYTAGNPAGLLVATVCGIGLDLAQSCPVPMTAALGLASLLAGVVLRKSRWLAAFTAAAVLLIAAALSGSGTLMEFWAALPGVFLALLLPGGLYRPSPSGHRPKPAVRNMQQAAGLFLELGDGLLETLPEMTPADPSMIFDRAADRVCKGCVLFGTCWSGACEAYDALCQAAMPMLQRGAVLRDDFPVSFLARCRRIEQLLTAINQELDGILYRRQFRHRLEESRTMLAEQYRIFSAYLTHTVRVLTEEDRKRRMYAPVLGVATRERRGNAISGDRGASFRTLRHLHYVLLCDGMGSGAEAMQESVSAVRLLQGLLTAGFHPEDALQMLNGIYLLRDDGAFSTVDLLEADLAVGVVTLWKWGSAPTYLLQDGELIKIGTALPPPGLEGTGRAERFQLSLGAGDLLVLLSDGADLPGTEEMIREWRGRSPKELAAAIVEREDGEEDDRTAVVLKLQPVASQRQHTTNCA